MAGDDRTVATAARTNIRGGGHPHHRHRLPHTAVPRIALPALFLPPIAPGLLVSRHLRVLPAAAQPRPPFRRRRPRPLRVPAVHRLQPAAAVETMERTFPHGLFLLLSHDSAHRVRAALHRPLTLQPHRLCGDDLLLHVLSHLPVPSCGRTAILLSGHRHRRGPKRPSDRLGRLFPHTHRDAPLARPRRFLPQSGGKRPDQRRTPNGGLPFLTRRHKHHPHAAHAAQLPARHVVHDALLPPAVRLHRLHRGTLPRRRIRRPSLGRNLLPAQPPPLPLYGTSDSRRENTRHPASPAGRTNQTMRNN